MSAFILSTILFSCKKKQDVETPDPEVPPIEKKGSITLNNDTRNYPLESIGENYIFNAYFSSALNNQSVLLYKSLWFRIRDIEKKYIGNIGGLTGTGDLQISMRFPPNVVFTETPKDFTLQPNSKEYGSAGFGIEMLTQSPDYKQTTGFFRAVTGQKVTISQKGHYLTVNIPYLKMNDIHTKKVVVLNNLKIVTE